MAGPRLVFLYGPPAVGKLTVARAIAEREPFKVLHNHVTIDPVLEVLPFGTKTFLRVVDGFRRDLVDAAAEEGIDLIYTFVYAAGEEEHVNAIAAPYEGAADRSSSYDCSRRERCFCSVSSERIASGTES
jgi:chloramphenicol 3-O-phosphotransferase